VVTENNGKTRMGTLIVPLRFPRKEPDSEIKQAVSDWLPTQRLRSLQKYSV
jgi:hypothetical protein